MTEIADAVNAISELSDNVRWGANGVTAVAPDIGSAIASTLLSVVQARTSLLASASAAPEAAWGQMADLPQCYSTWTARPDNPNCQITRAAGPLSFSATVYSDTVTSRVTTLEGTLAFPLEITGRLVIEPSVAPGNPTEANLLDGPARLFIALYGNEATRHQRWTTEIDGNFHGWTDKGVLLGTAPAAYLDHDRPDEYTRYRVDRVHTNGSKQSLESTSSAPVTTAALPTSGQRLFQAEYINGTVRTIERETQFDHSSSVAEIREIRTYASGETGYTRIRIGVEGFTSTTRWPDGFSEDATMTADGQYRRLAVFPASASRASETDTGVIGTKASITRLTRYHTGRESRFVLELGGTPRKQTITYLPGAELSGYGTVESVFEGKKIVMATVSRGGASVAFEAYVGHDRAVRFNFWIDRPDVSGDIDPIRKGDVDMQGFGSIAQDGTLDGVARTLDGSQSASDFAFRFAAGGSIVVSPLPGVPPKTFTQPLVFD